jgi:hypothetical protein
VIRSTLQHAIVSMVSVTVVACSGGQTNHAGSSDNIAIELRNMILSSKPEALSPADKNPSAVIMDIHVGEGVASVMSSSGGDASIYLSTGGGVIGGVGHENVRSAAVTFATEAMKHKAAMAPTVDFPYPAAGKVRFYLRAGDGVFFAEAPEAELVAGTHQLSGLFHTGQEVITQLRSVGGPRK